MELGQHQTLLLCLFAGLPALCLLGFLLPRSVRYKSGTQWLYSIVIHLSCLPGMFALALMAYQLFFTRENLLDANVLVYFLPPVSMGLTLVLIKQQVSFQMIPGFGRLIGLMGLMGLSFLGVLLLSLIHI